MNEPLFKLCDTYRHAFKASFEIDGAALLYAIAGNESTFGERREFVKHEAGYLPGGHYFANSPDLRDAYHQYGVLAGSSFGTWQLMYIVARELGFTGHPIELQHDETLLLWVVQHVQRHILKREPRTLADIFDAYNSGNFTDGNVPKDYILKGLHTYHDVENLVVPA
jgi:hypothetical protein